MQANPTIEVSAETIQILEHFYIAFTYSDINGYLTNQERGYYYEEYLSMIELLNYQLKVQMINAMP